MSDMSNNVYPLSLPQRDIYFEQLIHQGSSIYNIGAKVSIQGVLDPEVMYETVRVWTGLHQALRSVIKVVDGEPFLEIMEDFTIDYIYRDLSDAEGAEGFVEEYMQREFVTPIGIYGPELLWKFYLIKVSSGSYYILAKFHHLIVDGWATSLLFSRLADMYSSIKGGGASHHAYNWHYTEFIADDLRYQASQEYDMHRAYWKGKPVNHIERLPARWAGVKGAVLSAKSGRKSFQIKRALYNKLIAVSTAQGVTAFHFLLGLLYSYFGFVQGADELIFGLPLLNRPTKAFKKTVGLFTNILPFILSFDRERKFNELLTDIRKALQEDFRYQRFPMSAIAREWGMINNDGQPVYSIYFSYEKHNYNTTFDGNVARVIPLSHQMERTPVSVYVREFDEERDVIIDLDYNKHYYSDTDMEYGAVRLASLLEELVEDPFKRLKEISFLTEGERRLLVEGFNVSWDDREDTLLLEMIRKQVVRCGDGIALEYGDRAVSYGELELLSDRFGGYLKRVGVGRGSLVPVCVNRSIEMVVSILGILKAGGAYVPLDPTHPADRIEYILTDTGAMLSVVDRANRLVVSVVEGMQMVVVEDVLESVPVGALLGAGLSGELDHLPAPGDDILPGDRAYVMYTSGSTGRPKGVEVPHGAVANFLISMQASPGFTAADRVLAVTTYSFDISVLELFLPLVCGGCSVVAPGGVLSDVELLRSSIARYRPTVLQSTPSVWQLLVDSGWEGDVSIKALCGGEKLSRELGVALSGCVGELWNMYGPTETTVWSCIHRFTGDEEVSVIGRPIRNTGIYILDAGQGLAPLGAVGEICIGGRGLALGYLYRPELTAEKFVRHPYKEGERLYRTGDMGRWLADGTIAYIGRRDDQVKVRGHRIELGEIESVLLGHGGVRQAAVVRGEHGQGNVYLASYVVMEEGESVGELKSYVRTRLPEYMVPSYMIELEAMPLTANGKVDKRRLPGVETMELGEGAGYEGARDALEEKLVSIWEDVLGRKRIGIHDNFFELGGHSLNAARALARVHKELGVSIEVSWLFNHPTIEGLSRKVVESFGTEFYEKIPEVRADDDYELSHAQMRLWILSQFKHASAAYNLPFAYRLRGAVYPGGLVRSLDAVVRRHESLRTVIVTKDGEPRQKVIAAMPAGHLKEEDLRAVPGAEELLATLLEQDAAAPFDLETGPLYRVRLFRLGEEEYVFFMVIHHIITDGWSLEVMLKEMWQVYSSYLKNEEPALPDLRIQYKDYAAWSNGRMTGAFMGKDKRYWLDQFAEEAPALELGIGKKRPASRGYIGSVVVLQIERSVTERLKSVCTRSGATLFMTLLSAVKVLLHRYSGQTDIVVGTPIAGRDHSELEEQLGLYINMLALRTSFGRDWTFEKLLKKVRQTTLEGSAHGQYPFDRLVEDLSQKRDLGRSPLFDVVVNLQNGGMNELIFGDDQVGFEKFRKVPSGSKYDLSFEFMEEPEGIELAIEFRTDLFDDPTVAALGGHLLTILDAVSQDPGQRIDRLAMLSSGERQVLLEEFNVSWDDREDTLLLEMIRKQVVRCGDGIALEYGDRAVSYGELELLSDRFGGYLKRVGVGRGSLVPVCVNRSIEMVVSILGILKAGGAYVPLDPTHPADRIEYILTDTGAMLSVVDRANRLVVSVVEGMQMVVVEDVLESVPVGALLGAGLSGELDHLPAPGDDILPGDRAYVMYTSGSTGRPKGVEVPHGAVANFLISMQASPGFTAADRVLAVTTYSFDISVLELFLPLVCGGCSVVAPGGVLSDVELLRSSIARYRPTVLQSTPSVWQLLVDSGWEGDVSIKALCGGEKLSRELGVALSGCVGELWNMYGPTETTVWSCIHRFTGDEEVSVIGRPIRNTGIYILDAGQGLAPLGAVGEICIGGRGLALGYLYRPELTAEKFVRHPYKEGERLYRTGDMGRWLADGTIAYIGRRDDQVKVRGHRIELGEIESVLLGHGGVRQAAVVRGEHGQGNVYLASYVVMEEGESVGELKSYVRTRLPEYMVPSYMIELEAMPLTANGKVDKRRLPGVETMELSEGAGYEGARDALEEKLVSIWEDVLGRKRIGIHDSFFEVGGHSLLLMRLIFQIRKEFGVEVGIADLFDEPTIAGMGRLLSAPASASAELLPVLEAGNRPERLPLSYGQERMWFIDRLQGSVQYHLPLVLRMKGSVDEARLSYALQGVLQRHEVLRTVLREEEGLVYQHILGVDEWALSKKDGRGWSPEELSCYVREVVNEPFDLSADYLFRAELIRVKEEEYVLVVVAHHIVSDGWSVSILVREFNELYRSWQEGRSAALPVLAVQYADYAIWQRSYLGSGAGERQLLYWKEQLKDIAVLDLPTDYARPGVQSIRGARQDVWLDDQLVEGLRSLSQREGATMYMTMLSVFNVLLYRYSGQTDIGVGSPVANRRQKEVEDLVGFFVNTVVMRSDLDGDPAFRALLGRVKKTVISAYEHQDLPFERVVDEVAAQRDRSRSPLFQVMFAQMNTDNVPALSMEGLSWSSEGYQADTSKFDLTCHIEESSAGIRIGIEYCPDLFREGTIDRMMGHYKELLRSVVADAEVRIGELEMLTATEREQLISFNDMAVLYPKEKTIVDLIAEQVQRTPEAVAVVYEGSALTYRELDVRSNQLGHYLRGLGVQEESLVPICVERGLEMIVGILGILKAGGAYVPIDPEYPEDRVRYMLADTGGRIVLCSRKSKGVIGTWEAEALILLDEDWVEIGKAPTDEVGVHLKPDSLAYVIYTSGSTGRPKGVMIEHRNIVRLFETDAPLYDFNGNDVWTMFHSFCFDFSVWEMYGALFYGGRLVIVPKVATRDMTLFSELLKREGVTVLNQTPSAWYVLQDQLADDVGGIALRYVIFGGEALNPGKIGWWKDMHKDCRLINMYGITETTVHVTYLELNEHHFQSSSSLIGRPIPTLGCYIIDKKGALVPIGVSGEICVTGAGLARGYLNQPGLTAEKFVIDPFGRGEGGRMYKSGDLGRWLPDGTIVYMGRRDEQVKVRGHRIELGEIETVLGSYPGVRQVVVIVREDGAGEKRLVGYVVTEDGMDRKGMEVYLQERLPEYMVPRQWVELETLPLTSNGKADKARLPRVETMELGEGVVYEGARDALEEKLVSIWEEVLGRKRVGIHNSFFEMGGHSLLLMRLVFHIRKELGVEVGIADLFDEPTIAGMSKLLSDRAPAELLPVLEAGIRPERLPLSYGQERMWFIDRLHGSVQYHLPLVLRMKGSVDEAGLSHALKGVLQRHEVLRTVLREEEGLVYQHILGVDGWDLSKKDGRGWGAEELGSYIQLLVNTPFDLSADYLLRVELIMVSEEEYVLVVVAHHIVSDGWSLPILVREFNELYRNWQEGRSAALPILAVQYADYAIWQRSYLGSGAGERQLLYWKEQLKDIAVLDLPTDYVRPGVQSIRGARRAIWLDDELVEGLRSLSQREGATMYMTMLSVFNVLLYRYSGQTDIGVGSPVANRRQKEVEDLVGFFVNTVVMRSDLDGNPAFRGLLGRVKKTVISAYEHQDLPFERVVDEVVTERDRSRSPLFQIMFAQMNTDNVPALSMEGLSWSSGGYQADTSKFDLTCNIEESSAGIRIEIEYCPDLFREGTIDRMMGHYKELLRSVVADAEVRIGELEMLTAAERGQLLSTFNDTAVENPQDKTMISLFENHAWREGALTALDIGGRIISYQEMNASANRLARHLQQKMGVGRGDMVAIMAGLTDRTITAIMGIWKCGAVYVPIDADYPLDRKRYILQDCRAKLLLTESVYAQDITWYEGSVFALDMEWEGVATIEENCDVDLHAEDGAYVIYTSGTTGTPKGVMISHGSLLNMTLWNLSEFETSPMDRVLQFASLSFDASIWELSMAFGAGAALVLPDRDLLKDANYFKQLVSHREVTIALLPPTYANELSIETLSSLRILITGGERANVERSIEYSRWLRHYNAYGPTESTVIATIYRVGIEDVGCLSIPIGRPIRNTGIYIVDEERGLLPQGAVGEICIGGKGLALGYLHRPDLTAEKFVRSPFVEGERLYRTGDMGRWLPDGSIAYMGRRDEQVKVRGHRIELGEVESVLLGHGGVMQAAVVRGENGHGNVYLASYVVMEEGVSVSELKSYVRTCLPEYMVPSYVIALESIPLTANGKVDKRRLPEPEGSVLAEAVYVAPRNEAEEKLALIWEAVLGRKRIGIHDNFFELGGHSLLLMRLVFHIRSEFGVELGIAELFGHPTIDAMGVLLSAPAPAPAELLPVLEAGHRPERLPLSYGQERLWFIDQLEGSVQYHLPLVLRMKGSVDEAGLSYALKKILHRHEVLRTVLREEEGLVYQHILRVDEWELSKQDGRGWGAEDLSSYIRSLVSAPFDLSADYLLRAELIRVKEEEYMLVVVAHHIVSDGWSVPILVREFNELYCCWKEGRSAELPVLAVQYADYAIWQRLYLGGNPGERQLSYWKKQLKDIAVLELPTDHARPGVQSIRGARRAVWVDNELVEGLRSLSQREGVTMYMTLLSVFNVLLHRYSGQTDIGVGSPVANRRQKEVEDLVGFFLNTVVMRSDLSGDPTFRQLLSRVKETVVSAYDHQDLPFERVVDEVVMDRDRSRSPLFQVMFAQLNTDNIPGLSMDGLSWSTEDHAVDKSKFDMTCYIEESSKGVRLEMEYCIDLFREETIDRMIGHYLCLLRSASTDAGLRIGDLDMLVVGEREQLLTAFNDTDVDYPRERTVVDLIEEQVLRSPDAVAVVYAGQGLTYRELDARSNQLGHYLRGLGVQAESLVPICVERGFAMMIGILGILKAGGAYVPIDPEYPADRIRFMLEDIGAPWVLADGAGRAGMAGIDGRELIDLNDWSLIGERSTGRVSRFLRSEHLAYMIYTSGSTGRPKGVLVEHGSLVNRLRWALSYYGLGAEDKVLQKTTYCFDVSIGELLGPLLRGAAVVFARPGGHRDSRYIKDIIEMQGITMVHFVPSMLEAFLQEVTIGSCGCLRYVLCSGEALRADQVRLFRQRMGEKIALVNLYGPTEAAIEVTYWRAPDGDVRAVPIGRPLWNTRLYILDEHGGLCPVGVPGELWIGGVQVARGYWKRPELTAEKFVAAYGFGRLYRTGDICRWLEDGNIAYMGRRDDQVKVRGYRIELGEIETVLGGYPGVKQAVVLAKEDEHGQKRLVGYVVTEGVMDRLALERFIGAQLPEYMVPRQWVEILEMPLTGSGKVDRKALPEPVSAGALHQEYVAPRNEWEKKLASIWEEVLGLDRVGIYDSFFEMGGHSLLMIRVISGVRKALSVEMMIGDLFDHPTIAELGKKLSGEVTAFELPVLKAGLRQGRLPVSYGQERLWFIDRLGGSVQYHLPLVLRMKGSVDEVALSYALKEVVRRHEVLRTVLREDDGVIYQHILEVEGWRLSEQDGRGWGAELLSSYVREKVNAAFDLSADYLLRGELIMLSEEEYVLVATVHHIVSDGWSIPILVKEFNELYRSWKEGRAAELPVLAVQYADYAIWQRSYLGSGVGERQLSYWKAQLKDISILELPVDHARPAVQSIRGARRGVWVDESVVEAVRSLSQREGVTMYMVMLSAFNVLLNRYTGQKDIVVGSPVADRRQKEVEELVGFFVNTVVMRSDLSGDPTFRQLLSRVKETVVSAYDHQDLPFERVVDEVVMDRDRSRSPLFQVMFAQLNTDNVPGLSMDGLQWSSADYVVDTSKFDLTCYIEESSKGVRLEMEYCIDLFLEETIDRMIGHYLSLLRSAAANAGLRIGELELVTAAERSQLLSVFNDTLVDYPRERTVVDLIEEQVLRSPDAVALIFEGLALTYGELDAQSNQLGHYLRELGVQEESLVPICVERGFAMMIGILGILKAGGAYVPIDPEYPADRIRFMLEDIGAPWVLADGAGRAGMAGIDGRELIDLNDWSLIGERSTGRVLRFLRPEHLAYMIYTSGSTGRPKGVLVEHGSLVNRLIWAQGYYGLSAEDVVLQKTTYCFDVSVWELLWPLFSGSVIVFARPGGHRDSRYIKELIRDQGVTMVHFVPSMLEAFLQEAAPGECGRLLRVLCSGEALRADQVGLFRQRMDAGVELYNLYGPTEAAIDVTYWRAPEGEVDLVPIGRPVWNTQLYILDERGGLCPVGVSGELWIGGVQVARGYWKRPELTAEKFVNDAYGFGRLYRTGDICRWLEDGNIAYMGRRDDQVKVRGYRIELGEIETVLGGYPGVKQAVVLAREDGHGQKRLVGYVVTEDVMDKSALEGHIGAQLPEYMIPRQWVELDSLPLTGSGKVDRKALPEPAVSGLSVGYVEPRNEVEEMLVQIWQEVLRLDRVGINDNFFALGGDSIMTIQLVNRAQRAGINLEVRDVFSWQTIAGLSAMIADNKDSIQEADQGMAVGEVGLTPIQRMFFEQSRGYDHNHFNQSVLLRLDASIGMDVLSHILSLLVARHDSLRFVYRQRDGEWIQLYGENGIALIEDDLRGEDIDDIEELLRVRSGHYQQGLNIESGKPGRLVLYRLPEGFGGNRLLVVFHHLVVDAVSWRILVDDMQLILAGKMPGRKGVSYRIWYNGLERYSRSRRLLDQAPYWSGVVKAAEGRPSQDREVRFRDMATIRVNLPADKTRRLLHSASKGYRAEISDLLIAALAKILCEWSGKDNTVIALESHGREAAVGGVDTSATVGWFTSLYPVLLALEPGASYGSLIKSVKEQLRQVPDKGIGYGVLRYMNHEEILQGGDPWDVIFNYLGRLDNMLKDGGQLAASSEPVGDLISGDYPLGYKMMLSGYIMDGMLVIDWNYSTRHYEERSIQLAGQSFMKVVEELIAESEWAAQDGTNYTPSDFRLAGEIGYKELDIFLDQPVNGRSRRREEIEGLYRLSGTQEGILFHSLYEEGTGAYIIQLECTLSGLDEDLFRRSWSEVMRRHSILRSGFYYNELSIPVQCVYRSVAPEMEVKDWRGLDESEQAAMWRAYVSADKARGFEMGRAPLMRVGLRRSSDGNVYRMLWTLHHIISDGWSLPVIMEELLTVYRELGSGALFEQAAADNYEDYIRYLEGRDKEESENYWRAYLSEISGATLLPFTNPAGARNKEKGMYSEELLVVSGELVHKLECFARRNRMTVNTIVQAVWSFLLHRYTGRRDVMYGVTVSGRPPQLGDVEKRVGVYINTLPVRTEVSSDRDLLDWLGSIQEDQVRSRHYQYTSLREMNRWAGIKEELFDSLLVFENYPVSKLISGMERKEEGLGVLDAEVHEQNNYLLSVIVSVAEQMRVLFSYNSDLLSSFYVRRMRMHFEQVLVQIVGSAGMLVGALDLLSEGERNQLLISFNDTNVDYDRSLTIVDLIEEQVRCSPDAKAIVFEGATLTYRELDVRSNRLGHYLRGLGVKEESLVPICLERGFGMMIGILGIMKAGGAYVPIDPEYPPDRIRFILEDTGSDIVVTSGECRSMLEAVSGGRLIVEAGNDEGDGLEAGGAVMRFLRPEHLAYMIYTSGSTGRPKGVLVEHGSLANRLRWAQGYYGLGADDVVLQKTTYCFDVSVWELLWPLLSGSVIVFARPGGHRDSRYIKDIIETQGVTMLHFVPSMLEAFLQDGSAGDYGRLRKVLCSGEALRSDQVRLYRERMGEGIELHNLYGPTEAAIDVTYWSVPSGDVDLVPIGRPVWNTQLYILEEGGRVCPVGVPGELWIGGVQVARGYWNRPELTAEKFVGNMFGAGRLYRTGDICRWLEDGNIAYMGRHDDQVKVRGYRIELGEIESLLVGYAGVRQAVVMAREDGHGQKRLVGYVVMDGSLDRAVVERHIGQQLPEYMVPRQWVELSELPLTGSGKVDRKALPEPSSEGMSEEEYAAPRNEMEALLVRIWQEVLRLECVGINDNFFALGGDSINAMQVVSRLRLAGYALHTKQIFQQQTIAGLSVARVMEPLSTKGYEGLEVSMKNRDYELDDIMSF